MAVPKFREEEELVFRLSSTRSLLSKDVGHLPMARKSLALFAHRSGLER